METYQVRVDVPLDQAVGLSSAVPGGVEGGEGGKREVVSGGREVRGERRVRRFSQKTPSGRKELLV